MLPDDALSALNLAVDTGRGCPYWAKPVRVVHWVFATNVVWPVGATQTDGVPQSGDEAGPVGLAPGSTAVTIAMRSSPVRASFRSEPRTI
jgi:hypothetical protein